MGLKTKLAALAFAVIAAAGLTTTALPGTASATTLTCTNIATATVPPFGCGGLQSSGTLHGPLDLAHASGNLYNSLVTMMPDTSSVTEDWTVFQVEGLSGAGGLGVYVAMDSQDGLLTSFTPTTTMTCTLANGTPVTYTAGTFYQSAEPCPGQSFTAGPGDLCISVEHAAHVPDTNGKLRWWAVLRTCSTNGTFTYGSAAEPGTVTAGFANQWQAWAPVIDGNGYLMVNTWLFNHDNINYALDITADGGAGTPVQAYPENDQIWEQWNIIGCTLPASHLGGVTAPKYVNCP